MDIDKEIDFRTAAHEEVVAYFEELETARRELRGEEREEVEAFIKVEAARMRRELDENADEGYAKDAANYAQQLSTAAPATEPEYKVAKRMEYSVDGDSAEGVLVMSRTEYTFHFKAHARNTARATLEMCRLVYSARKTLSEVDFDTFCQSIGYKEDSSTIRKFLTIGKVYPRLIDVADKLPIAWTSIYQLTQIPADDFERCIAKGFAFNKLTGSELKALVDKTKDANDVVSPFKQDKKIQGYRIANVFFTKLPDDTDFRLLERAFDEVMARLPVRIVLDKQIVERFDARRKQRYERLKQEPESTAVKPQDWDYGTAANEVHSPPKAAA
jgi:hypothetical protein